MKPFQYLLVSLFLLVNSLEAVVAQNIVVKQSNESGIYKKGENISVTIHLNKPVSDSILIKTWINYSAINSVTKIKYNDDTVVFNDSFDAATSVILHITAGNETSKIGLVVAPEGFKPETKYPKDLKRYWKTERKALRNLPMEIKSTSIPDFAKGFVCTNVEINCTGPKPARGYFVKPEDAKEKSLPIVLVVHAAGVKGSWCLSKPENALRYAQMGAGALCFDLNAHGMLNGQPQEYYDNLEAGELNGYMHFGLENRDSLYFRGMYLRLLRTLDFLAQQPEWDGKRILVIGESQGGGQALVAAGLDSRVTAVVATVPAMCDWGRTLIGQKGGWPDPFATTYNREKMLKTVPYFDAAHLLKGSKATLCVEIGFIDETCPSSAVYAAINQSKGKKIIIGVPYREHILHQQQYRKVWEETVLKPKNNFIEDFISSNNR